MKLWFSLLSTCAMLSTFTCVDFNTKKRLCGRNLMLHIQNICEHTQCSESPVEENSPEASTTARVDSKNRYRALPRECCTRGCSILTIQLHCCGNHSIVKTDPSADLENVDTSYNEYTMNASMEDEVNQQQREIEAINKSQQTGRHRRRHHQHHHHPRHNGQGTNRNFFSGLYMTPVTDEKLQLLRKKLLHKHKNLDGTLEF